MAMVGIPSIVLMAVLTGILIIILQGRKKPADSRAAARSSSGTQRSDTAVSIQNNLFNDSLT